MQGIAYLLLFVLMLNDRLYGCHALLCSRNGVIRGIQFNNRVFHSVSFTTTQLLAKRRTTISRRTGPNNPDESQSSPERRDDEVEESDRKEETDIDDIFLTNPTTLTGKAKDFTQLLADDISEFEKSRNMLMQARERERIKSSSPGDSSAALQSIKDIVGVVLIGDFFVVMVFLVWFLFAAAMQKTNPFFLEKFQDIFQPVVVPCLTVLMAGSIASGVMGDKKKDEQ